jgi:hypothetical protein
MTLEIPSDNGTGSGIDCDEQQARATETFVTANRQGSKGSKEALTMALITNDHDRGSSTGIAVPWFSLIRGLSQTGLKLRD